MEIPVLSNALHDTHFDGFVMISCWVSGWIVCFYLLHY